VATAVAAAGVSVGAGMACLPLVVGLGAGLAVSAALLRAARARAAAPWASVDDEEEGGGGAAAARPPSMAGVAAAWPHPLVPRQVVGPPSGPRRGGVLLPVVRGPVGRVGRVPRGVGPARVLARVAFV